MEPSHTAWNVSLKAGNMFLNRFCIDEDAAFELSGINYIQKSVQKSSVESEEKGKNRQML